MTSAGLLKTFFGNETIFFFLQRHQNSEHFPDEDGPHQAGRLWPRKEARL